MISGVFRNVCPTGFSVDHGEHPGHPQGIPRRGPDPMAGPPRGPTALPHGGTEEGDRTATSDRKGLIQLGGLVGDRPRLRPRAFEKTIPRRPLTGVHEEHRREVGRRFRELPKLRHGFTAEESAEVTKKDEQGEFAWRELFVEGRAGEISPLDRKIPYLCCRAHRAFLSVSSERGTSGCFRQECGFGLSRLQTLS